MHFNIQFLIEADSAETAEQKVEEFLESYEHKEWDWYGVGGRYTGLHLTEVEQKKLSDKVDRHESDIINFTGDQELLFKLIDEMIGYTRSNLEDAIRNVSELLLKAGGLDLSPGDLLRIFDAHGEKDEYHMIPYYMTIVGETMNGYIWTNDVHFFDIDGESKFLTKKRKDEIKKEPEKFWLVTMDIHN